MWSPHFTDEMYVDVKTPEYNIRGLIIPGLNVQGHNVRGRIIPLPQSRLVHMHYML
jgi:hypothetical protein